MPASRVPRSDPSVDPPVPDPEFWGDTRRADDARVRGVGERALRRPERLDRPFDRARDRLQLLRGDPRVGVALLVVIAVVAGFLWYRAGVDGAGGAPPPRAAVPASQASPPTSAPAAVDPGGADGADDHDEIVVHVAGAVAEPGVVELPRGSRVTDAIEAAGGGVPEADLDRLNLAARLVDGQRVLVQKVGEPPAPAEPTTPGDDPAAAGPLNLNTATVEQLDDALPGIGPTLAAAIVSEREERGGFRSVNELRDVRGIGEKRFADIVDKVTV